MINVFGGSTVQPAQVSYRAVALAANVALVWPAQSVTSTDVMARTLAVTPSAPGLSIALPDATAASVGYDFLVSNLGAVDFLVTDSAGGAVATVVPGAASYIQLTLNTTPAGAWSVIHFGATTSSADAASLAGPLGVAAFGGTLGAAFRFAGFSAGNTIATTDRASAYVWTGGTGTQTLPLSTAMGGDFFYEVRNQGTGVLTLTTTGGETIDGAASILLQPGDSCFVHSSGTGTWFTVGRGRAAQFNFTLLVKAVASGTYTLTPTEAANTVQRYTGALVGNVNIVLPSVVQVYYVSNLTTGAFSLTFKTAGVGTTITVPSNQNAVLFCDGVNVVNASTTVSGLTAIILAQGAVGSPSIAYSGDLTTGIYQPVAGSVAVTISGAQRAFWDASGQSINGALSTVGNIGAGVTAAARLHAKSSASILRLESTTARGSGAAYASFYDPTGEKGFWGYGNADDRLSLWNRMNAPVTIGANNVEVARWLANGSYIVGATTQAGIGNGAADISSFNGSIGVTTQVNFNSATFGQLVNRAAGGMRIYTNAAAVIAAEWNTAGALSLANDLTVPGNTILGDALGDTLNVAAGALVVSADGRVSGNKLHNVGSVGGTATGYLASGTWTPTLTGVFNVTSSTAFVGQWTRVGNVVTFSVYLEATATANSVLTSVGVSLPIASAFTLQNQLVGGANVELSGRQNGGAVYGDTVNDRLQVDFLSLGAGTVHPVRLTGSYVVV